MKSCNSNQLRNPATNRCVKKTGAIGKSVLSGRKSRNTSPKKSRASPTRGRSTVKKGCPLVSANKYCGLYMTGTDGNEWFSSRHFNGECNWQLSRKSKSPPTRRTRVAPARKSKSPPARKSKSPPARRTQVSPARKSKSPPARRTQVSPARKSKSPPTRRSKSPPSRKSKSPPARRSKSPPVRGNTAKCERQVQPKVSPTIAKKYAGRPSPPFPANECCGMSLTGNDANKWVSQRNVKGICQWKKVTSGGSHQGGYLGIPYNWQY